MSRTPPPPDPASSDGGLGAAVAAAVERVVRAASRHPRVVLATAGLVVVVAGALSASLLRVNADQDAMFSDELPHRVVEIAYMREFPALYENVVVVVDGDDEERVRDGAAALAARMRSEPAYFRNVYLPRGEFFEQNALLYMSTDELEDFAVFYQGQHPSAILEVTLVGVNIPVLIGGATVMPGDVVLGTPEGLSFIPPHLAAEVANFAEETAQRDVFGKWTLDVGRYQSSEIDVNVWADHIEADYKAWCAEKGYEYKPKNR